MHLYRISLAAVLWFLLLTSLAFAQQAGFSTQKSVKGTFEVTGVIEVIGDGQVDWTRGEIQAKGLGVPPAGVMGAKARLMAREAAIVIAERNLVKIVHGIHVYSETTVRNLVLEEDVIRENVEGFIKGAIILSEKEFPDGSCEIVIGLNMYGSEKSLARSIDLPTQVERVIPEPEIVEETTVSKESPTELGAEPVGEPVEEPIPEEQPEEETATETGEAEQPEEETVTAEPMAPVQPIENEGYTGLILDCRGLPLYRCMCPKILDENGRDLWATVTLPEDLIIEKGLVAYYLSLEDAINVNRVGDNPLVVNAIDVVGPNIFKTSAVISDADAARIVAENARSLFLENLAVGFLED